MTVQGDESRAEVIPLPGSLHFPRKIGCPISYSKRKTPPSITRRGWRWRLGRRLFVGRLVVLVVGAVPHKGV
jgi:hypothetical protein